MRHMHHYFELLWGMTEKELKARYKHTLFGFFWLIANPLLQMIVIGFVFTFFMKEPIEHYYFHLFVGLLVWNFFSVSVNKATTSIVFERSLVKKAAFAKSVIPLSIVLSNFIHLTISLLLYVIPVLFLGTFSLFKLPFFLLSLIVLLVFTSGISLLTCALNVRFRDVAFFTQAILTVWFYATPIVYSLTFIPYRYIWFWRINPLTSILQFSHFTFLNANAPGPLMITLNIGIVLLITLLGVLIFRHESKNFDDWV